RTTEIAQETAGDLRLEDHRHAAGGDLARAQAADGPPAGFLPDGLRRIQPVQLPADGVPVIALHQPVLHSDRRHGARETRALVVPVETVAIGEHGPPPEGAKLCSLGGRTVFANSHGFYGDYQGSSFSCAV